MISPMPAFQSQEGGQANRCSQEGGQANRCSQGGS
jgi:hypothetical protein